MQGRVPLRGHVHVSGNKNAIAPLLVAALLTKETCTFTNVPENGEADLLTDLLGQLGAVVTRDGRKTMRVSAETLRNTVIDETVVSKMRGSLLVLAPILARCGSVALPGPGGDFPMARTCGVQLRALEQLGAKVLPGDRLLVDSEDGLTAADIYLPEASVTTTELIMIAAAAIPGLTTICNAASEPHVGELGCFLRAMGADVEGHGTSRVRIRGSERLRGASHQLRGDYLEAMTWAVMAIMSDGEVTISGANPEDLKPGVALLNRMRVNVAVSHGSLDVFPSRVVSPAKVTAGNWPGFPSDMMSLFAVLSTQAEGKTLLHEWFYEFRLRPLQQINRMGAAIDILDPHRVLVRGSTNLRAHTGLAATDIRNGAALLAAALAADGESRLDFLDVVERGYERVASKLASLGALVETISD